MIALAAVREEYTDKTIASIVLIDSKHNATDALTRSEEAFKLCSLGHAEYW
jgi:hypothetical protein